MYQKHRKLNLRPFSLFCEELGSTFLLQFCTEGFHARDLYNKVTYFEGVTAQDNNDLDSKRLFDNDLIM